MRFSKRSMLLASLARASVTPLLLLSAAATVAVGQTSNASQASTSSTVSGRVINASSGVPLPRALVQMGAIATFTDHEGKFVLPDVPTGSTLVEITKPGYFTSPEQIDPPGVQLSAADQTHSVELRLYPEAVLTGSVLAQDGLPLAQLTVTARKLTTSGVAHRLQVAATAQTDSRGEFRLAVPAGDYQIMTQFVAVSPETGLTVLPAIAPAGGSTGSLHVGSGEQQQVQLRAVTGLAHTVTLSVQGLSDERSSTIQLTGANGAFWQMNAQPDSDTGEMTLRLPAGSYLLDVNATGSDVVTSGAARLTVPDRDSIGPTVQLSPVAAIPVEVILDARAATTASGAPTAQQLGLELVPEQQRGRGSHDDSIRLQSHFGRPPSFSPLPGQYRLVSSSRGSWYLQSAVYGGAEVLGGLITVAAGTGSVPLQLTVGNATGSLQGQVTSGNAPMSAWVNLIPNFPSASPILTLRSASDGTFSAQTLEPGNYFAVVLEHRTSADLLDPAVRNSLGSRVQTVTIRSGVSVTLDLDGRSAP